MNCSKDALATVLNREKNMEIIEKYASIQAKKTQDFDKTLKSYIYEIIGDVINKKTLVSILEDLKLGNVGWNHKCFATVSNQIEEQNDFIINPFEVEEGVFICKAINKKTGKICGSTRVFSYGKQDRSSDEPMSVYCQCVACYAKWRERG